MWIIAPILVGEIVLVAGGIWGFIFFRNLFLRNKHLRESKGKIWATVFVPSTNSEINTLFTIGKEPFKVFPPNEPPFKDGRKKTETFYYAIPHEIDDKSRKPVMAAGRLTSLTEWPPGKPTAQQVQIQHGYWNLHDPRPLNPNNDFLPVNTDEITRILADAEGIKAVAALSEKSLEEEQAMRDNIKGILKSLRWSIALDIGTILLMVGLIIVIVLVLTGQNAIKEALGV